MDEDQQGYSTDWSCSSGVMQRELEHRDMTNVTKIQNQVNVT